MPRRDKTACTSKAAILILLFALATSDDCPLSAVAQDGSRVVQRRQHRAVGRCIHPDEEQVFRSGRCGFQARRQRHRWCPTDLLGYRHLGHRSDGGYAPAKIEGETINETHTNLPWPASGCCWRSPRDELGRASISARGRRSWPAARIRSTTTRARPTSAARREQDCASRSERVAAARSGWTWRTISTTATSAGATSSRTTSSRLSACRSDWAGTYSKVGSQL